jgi:integrase
MGTFFAYARVSTPRQGERGVSLPEQKNAIERYARAHSLQIGRWFEEQQSASHTGRPAFVQMLRLLRNPLSRMPLVRERRIPRRVMSVAEEGRLLQASAPHLRAIIIAALDAGMRRGELLGQRWEHVDLGRGLLSVTRSKTAGGEGREIPLTRRLQAQLAASAQPTGLLFTFKDQPIRIVKTAWKAAIRRAGICYYRFHDLRHAFNTRLMEAGVMQEVRKTLMGHSSGEDTNSIYTHIELPLKREAIRKLEAWVEREKQKIDQQGGRDDSTEVSRTGSAEGRGCGSGRSETVEKENPGRRGA